MKVVIVKDKTQMGATGAKIIADDMRGKPRHVLGLATGTTPIPLYQELIRMHREEGLDFSSTTTFNLDEYIGLDPAHPQSYRYFMNAQLFDHINIPKENTHVPDGMAEDVDAFCKEYERMIRDAGGIDLQLLGIGSNGHIGFNEPGTPLDSRTHRTGLTESTINDNARLFDRREDVPVEAVTMGVATIMDARRVLLLACGENKAASVAAAVEGPVTPDVPASALQNHEQAAVVVAEDAAAGLKGDYERS